MQESLQAHSSTYQRSKIIATVGPAVSSYEMLEGLLLAGVRGFRMNFSHAEYEKVSQNILWIREASEKHGKPVSIIQDLQGPKIRLGEIIDDNFEVKTGDELRLVYGAEHNGSTLPSQYDLSTKVKVGERVYLYDGRVHAKAIAVNPEEQAITILIENDGVLKTKKGINLPDTDFGGDILTPKDLRDMEFGAKEDFDYVALSFVQSAGDIQVVREKLKELGSEADVLAKVETRAAIAEGELEKIVEVSDGVMIARGDLAIEVGAEIVPVVQREIIALCQKHAKISIVATQMMVSMTDSPQPTRAEVSDVAAAVTLGSDCLMLSEETAVGKYPIEVIKTMRKVITYTQSNIPVNALEQPELPGLVSGAISSAATKLARAVDAQAIIAETRSGATAHHISAYRPKRPILSVTSDKRVAQKLALLYANKSYLREDSDNSGFALAQELADEGYIVRPATLVLVSGLQPGVAGGTDTVRVRMI